jgi:serine/threonine protein phosphatase PrpC
LHAGKRLDLEDGDIIVLASDGLQSLAEEDIASILDKPRITKAATSQRGADAGRRR